MTWFETLSPPRQFHVLLARRVAWTRPTAKNLPWTCTCRLCGETWKVPPLVEESWSEMSSILRHLNTCSDTETSEDAG